MTYWKEEVPLSTDLIILKEKVPVLSIFKI
jgi:hypothetical protein